MPQSTINSLSTHKAFTLVEVMLVMLLIGLLATTVVMNLSSESREDKLHNQSERFVQLFQFVAETAMLKQQEWGVYITPQKYGFLYYDSNEAKWLPAEEPASLQAHDLPEHITLQLELEGLPGADSNLLSEMNWQLDEDDSMPEDNTTPVLPQVFILSSGEISPFKLVFTEQSELSPLYVAVSTDFAIPLNRTEVSKEQP